MSEEEMIEYLKHHIPIIIKDDKGWCNADAVKDIKELQNRLQQKENIIKELKERSLQYSEEIDRLLDIKEKS